MTALNDVSITKKKLHLTASIFVHRGEPLRESPAFGTVFVNEVNAVVWSPEWFLVFTSEIEASQAQQTMAAKAVHGDQFTAPRNLKPQIRSLPE